MKNILISWRHIKNDKSNSIINIVGLGIALGVFAVAMVFVGNEYSYNRCFKDSNRIYRVNVYDSMFNRTNNSVPYVLSKTLVADYPQVEDACALTGNYYKVTAEKTDQEIPVSGVTPNFFDMFGIEVIEGDVYNLDKVEKSIILTQSQARSIFGKEHCVGEILPVKWSVYSYEGDEERTADLPVVAVVADYSQNVTFKTTAFLSTKFWLEHTYNNGFITPKDFMEKFDLANHVFGSIYVKMAKQADLKEFESKMNEDAQRLYKEGTQRHYFLYQPITDIYFDKVIQHDEDHKNNGNRLLCKTTFFIGLLILLIAFFNYVNLASATADRRLRTQAICQINGARTGNIVWQSIVESLMLIVLSLPLSVLVAIYGLPKISTLFEIDASLSFVGSFASLVVVWAVTAILFGLFSGFAIKFRLRRISLADAVKSSVIKTSDRLVFTNILTIIQIAIFCGLFTSILLMDRQIKYALKADAGFDKDGLLVVNLKDNPYSYSIFKDEACKLPGVIGLAGSSTDLLGQARANMGFFNDSIKEYFSLSLNCVDMDFFKVIGATIIDGKDFEKEKSALILNQKGQQFTQWQLGEQKKFGGALLQGVVKDFNFGNAHSEIEPTLYIYNDAEESREDNKNQIFLPLENVMIRVNLMQTPNIVSDIEKVYKKVFPDTDFKWYFADEKLAESYQKDRNYSFVISALTIIALFIAIIGIIGLSTALNQKRVKEIGIRKVNGATSAEILQMLCRRYIWMVAVAIAVSVPCAYSFVAYWLKDFAYKIGITPEPFIISAIATLLIVLATVAIQSLSVARRNPVEAIKTE